MARVAVEYLFKDTCHNQLIKPHSSVALRGDSVPGAVLLNSRGSKALELGKPWGIALCHTVPAHQAPVKAQSCALISRTIYLAMQGIENSGTLKTRLELPSPCSGGSVFTT